MSTSGLTRQGADVIISMTHSDPKYRAFQSSTKLLGRVGPLQISRNQQLQRGGPPPQFTAGPKVPSVCTRCAGAEAQMRSAPVTDACYVADKIDFGVSELRA